MIVKALAVWFAISMVFTCLLIYMRVRVKQYWRGRARRIVPKLSPGWYNIADYSDFIVICRELEPTPWALGVSEELMERIDARFCEEGGARETRRSPE